MTEEQVLKLRAFLETLKRSAQEIESSARKSGAKYVPPLLAEV